MKTTISSLTAQVRLSRRCLLRRTKSSSRQGQIELYTHHPFLPRLVRDLNRLGLRTCAAYLIESQFMEDKYKFFRCAFPSSSILSVCHTNPQRRAVCDVSDGQP